MIGVALVAPSIRYLWWLITLGRDIWCTNAIPYAQKSLPVTSRSAVRHTTRKGDGANDRGDIDPIRNGHAFDDTGYSDPFCQMGRTLRKSAVTFSARGMTMN